MKRKYRNNFITNAICRFDFIPINEINETFATNYRSKIKTQFQKFKEDQLKGYQAKFGKEGFVGGQEIPPKTIYMYIDKDEVTFVKLSDDYLVIESKNYEGFKKFNESIELALSSLIDLHKKIDFTRLGLRFINQIVIDKGNPFVWKNYLDPSLYSVIDRFFEEKENLSRVMSQAILNFDDYKLNFNYGMHNSEFPAKISRKEFILDFDFYSEYVEQDLIMDQLKEFNIQSAIMFEKCIRKGLRKKMGEIENE